MVVVVVVVVVVGAVGAVGAVVVVAVKVMVGAAVVVVVVVMVPLANETHQQPKNGNGPGISEDIGVKIGSTSVMPAGLNTFWRTASIHPSVERGRPVAFIAIPAATIMCHGPY